MNELGLSEDEARQHLINVGTDRTRFVHHYFRADYDDVSHFDLVVNNEFVDLDASVEIVKAALRSRIQSGK